jgi:hypothetical protein
MENLTENLILLDILGRILDANKGSSINSENEQYIECLANKAYNHVFFSHVLASNKNVLKLPSGVVELSGFVSIDVLIRAAFESFLVFHYVFFQPKDNKESLLQKAP